jgi:aspartate racemase
MLGIIGGMGPKASLLFYQMITEKTGASTDQGNLDLILVSRASMPDRTDAILSGEKEKIERVKAILLKDAALLEDAGCRAIAVTCNTAHYFVDMIEDQVKIPFIHMIRETGKRLEDEVPGGKVAILATDGTVKTGLYQKELEARGLEAYVPTEAIQKLVMATIYDLIKAGKPSDAHIWKEIEDEIKEASCDAAILACTELSIVKNELDLGEFYFDPMNIMAEACLSYCRKFGDI